MKEKLIYVATFLILLSCMFKFDSNGIFWFWESMTQVPIILVTFSIGLILIRIWKAKREYGS